MWWTVAINFLRKNWVLIICIIIALFLFLYGFKLGRQSVKCPEIKAGIIQIDTIIVHDTMPIVITRDKIKEKIVPVEVYVKDSSSGKVIVQKDTSRCYSMDTSIAGAYLSAELCSRFFPVSKPFDLTGSFQYSPPPDTERIRIDTVTFKKPFFKEPRNYIIGGLLAVIGTGIYLELKR